MLAPEWQRWFSDVVLRLTGESQLLWDQLDLADSDLADLETRSHQALQDILPAVAGADTTKNRHVSDADAQQIATNTTDIATNASDLAAHTAATAAHGSTGDLVGTDDYCTEALGGTVLRAAAVADIGALFDPTAILTGYAGTLTSTAVGTMTASVVATVSSSDIAAVSASDITALTASTLTALTASDVTAVSASDVTAVSSADVSAAPAAYNQTWGQEVEALANELKTRAGENLTLTNELKTRAGESRTLTVDLRARAVEAKTLTDDLRTRAVEARTLANELKTRAGEARALANEMKTRLGEVRTYEAEVTPKVSRTNTFLEEIRVDYEGLRQVVNLFSVAISFVFNSQNTILKPKINGLLAAMRTAKQMTP
jgi:hypothetical protein